MPRTFHLHLRLLSHSNRRTRNGLKLQPGASTSHLQVKHVWSGEPTVLQPTPEMPGEDERVWTKRVPAEGGPPDVGHVVGLTQAAVFQLLTHVFNAEEDKGRQGFGEETSQGAIFLMSCTG